MDCCLKSVLRHCEKHRIGFVICALVWMNVLFGQSANFGKPLNIPLELSGSFAELRSNHFHGGLDFKTQQKEGLPVYAVADGRLSRVVVSGTGYGKALYISHSGGMMSVYAHMSGFVPSIDTIVNKQHYAKQSFELDFQLPNPIRFKKGDLIGYSGNTGSSGGPHLHFELRNKYGENALNPTFYGYAVKDDTPPIISTFAVYPKDHNSVVENQQTPLLLPVKCRGKNCFVKDTIRVLGQMAFGIEAIDKANGSANKLGLYAMKLFIDDELQFAWKIDSVPFSQTRYINAFFDYAHYDSTGRRIQWTCQLPANRLNIYEKVNTKGVYSFFEQGTHDVRIEASDAFGNTAVLNTVLMVDTNMVSVNNEDCVSDELEHRRFFSHAIGNTFETDEIKIVIPQFALYEPIYFDYSVEPSLDPRVYSNVHYVHHSGTPVHRNYSLKIKSVGLPGILGSKALIASWNASKNEWVAEGGQYKDGFVWLNIRKFSIFAVCMDTINPTVKPIDVRNNTVLLSQNVLTFRIEDDFSGIGTYVATLDGRWFLMTYDPKTRTLKGAIDTKLTKGEHDFKLTVSDKMNNSTTYTAKIIR
ncbi:MAG: M23 family metallopeptidase [Bacteroidales bacterium]|jgi:murein DD-endopeptidase MepM/ murein hydrolase activator NlpD|nr:M23 family metallopeptidase [Bacteroidales bacterium]